MNSYARSADSYLTQRILGANLEQQAALIMEAGQLHLGKAIQALTQNNLSGAASSLMRVAEVIKEAHARLNLEGGGELAQNLEDLYEWWSKEILAASHTKNIARLEAVGHGMGEIREAWERYDESRANVGSPAGFEFGNLVV